MAAPGSDMHKLIVDTFKKFDENGDGIIDRSELKRVLQSLAGDAFDEATVEEVLVAADTNQDGKIQYEEFVNWVLAEQGEDASPAAGGASPSRKSGAQADEDCPLERRGSLDLNFRSFLPERFEVDVAKRYALDKLTLGEGGYGKVFIAADKEFENRKVAVKKVTKTRNQAAMDSLGNEINIMKELDHPNICKLLATFEHGRNMFFVMELCEGGELFDRIIESGMIGEKLTADIVGQATSALSYAHSRGIAHRDMKPENVVFCTRDPEDTHIKLIDWGLAQSFLGASMNSSVGSFTYAAPEVIDSGNISSYTAACDLWSVGVLTYVMLCGKPPFWGNHSQHMRNARAEKYPMKGDPWTRMNPQAKDFVKRLLKAKPEDRMPIDQCCEHPWLLAAKDIVSNSEDQRKEATEIMTNLKHFANANQFSKMCITAVARQLDHKHLRGIHSVFRELDVNGDGVLSFEEISNGFSKIFGPDSEEARQVKNTFDELDLDGSDSIDYTEFCAAGLGQKTATQEDVIWAAFKTFDTDNSGFIEKRDLQQILDVADVQDAWSGEVCSEVAHELLEKHDADGDGKICFEDWKKIMLAAWERHIDPDSDDEEKEEAPKELRRNVRAARTVTAYDLLLKVNRLPEKA